MAGIPGFGEAAISICSPPSRSKKIELCIRNVGSLTGKLCALKKSDTIWLRGPMGRGFSTPPKGEDLLFVTGGMGIVPARSLIKAVIKKRKSYGKITILYGIKDPNDLLFTGEITEWKKAGATILITVDTPHAGWRGHTGVVTTLIDPLAIDAPQTTAFVIGPPIMYRYIVPLLVKKGILQDKTFLSLERRMRCGLGKCGHCLIGGVYACKCGPVFSLAELADMPGAI
jgi:NAD(P)H-flavin reductase